MYKITVVQEEEYTSPTTTIFCYLSLKALQADLDRVFDKYLGIAAITREKED